VCTLRYICKKNHGLSAGQMCLTAPVDQQSRRSARALTAILPYHVQTQQFKTACVHPRERPAGRMELSRGVYILLRDQTAALYFSPSPCYYNSTIYTTHIKSATHLKTSISTVIIFSRSAFRRTNALQACLRYARCVYRYSMGYLF